MGGGALPVFTTVERLVSVLGPRQPWIALPLRDVEQIMAGADVHRVALDPDAEPGAWRWQASGIEALGWRHECLSPGRRRAWQSPERAPGYAVVPLS
jgi:hypothetical protein